MLHRRNRLTRSRDFDRVYRAGRSVGSRPLVVYYFSRSKEESAVGGEEVRVGFSVSKRLGSAVQRNRIKRCLREAFRINADKVRPGVDIVFIARPDLVPIVEEAGTRGVEARMLELLRKAGLLVSGEGQGT